MATSWLDGLSEEAEKVSSLESWLYSQIDRCEKEIEDGGAFYDLQSEKEAYEKVLEKIGEL